MHDHILSDNKSAHDDYDACTACGSLFRRDVVDPAALYGANYWDTPGRSTLEDQVYNLAKYENDAGQTKCDAVLQYCGEGLAALEIACAPGEMLWQLGKRFRRVVGVEYDAAYRDRIRRIAGNGARLIFGSFPQVTADIDSGLFDCIVAMDILEHVVDGQAFVAEVHRLLRPGGRAVFMLPMISDGVEMPERMFCEEHVALYSQRYVCEWFCEVFDDVKFDSWLPGHEIVVGAKGLQA